MAVTAIKGGPRTFPANATAGPLIEARGLALRFGQGPRAVDALRDVTLSLPPGSLFALLGPNGAGKTSFIRCVTSLLQPTAGQLRVFGQPPDRSHLRRMGVCIENPGDYRKLTAMEYLDFFGSFYGLEDAPERARRLALTLELEPDPRPIRKLSLGNRQKLQLIRSLLHDPELLIWDEPTANLDPGSQQVVLEHARRHALTTGASVLLATHQLEQIERFATHFGFLRHGRLAFSGSRDETLASLGGESLRIDFEAAPPEGCLPELVRALGPFELRWESAGLAAVVSGEGLVGRIPDLVQAMATRGLRILEVRRQGGSLLEIFNNVMAREEGPRDGGPQADAWPKGGA